MMSTSPPTDRDCTSPGQAPVLAPGLPAWVTADLLARTRTTWQRYYAQRLTDDEVVEILLNVGRLADVLEGLA